MWAFVFNLLQLLGGIILSIGYIPQIQQILRTKSAKDFNLSTFLSLAVGISMMEMYAIYLVVTGSGFMFLLTNTSSLIIQIIMCMLI